MLTIGRLAKKTGVTTDCVRFYERVGLLAAADKTSSGYRLYSDECVQRIQFIKHAQRCGFSLPQIRDLLNAGGGAAYASCLPLAREKMLEIEDTIEVLRTMNEVLSSYVESCEHPEHMADSVRRRPHVAFVSQLAAATSQAPRTR